MMPFVDDADVQIHLPVDTLKVEEIPDDLADAKQHAERIVRGYLAGVFEPATISDWDEPEDTPEQIRAVTGMFTGAHIYRLRFGQSSMTDPAYAQAKYNEAMTMLNAIIGGTIVLIDPTTGEPILDTSTDFDNTWFQPNDESTPPFFTMDARF